MLRSLLNQRLGRYDVKELLGRGGMAAVYRAVDTVLLRDVALKLLYPQFGDDAALVQRFQREAVTAASLEHPNIVPIYDVGEHDGMAYIAMKLLSGQTMQDWLQGVGSVDLDTLLNVLAPVAAALDYAHARGVVHRDIKPGNIFLSDSAEGRRVLLTDFGIAKQLDTPGLTTTGAMIGTPDYMAPEQIAGRPVDARTDVYALGMLAYRALTGRRAFEGTTQDVLLGHLYNRPTPPSQLNPALPPAVDAVIDQATAADPAQRFASAGAFVAALRQVARSVPAGTAVGIPPPLAARPTAADTAVGTPPALPPRPAPGSGPDAPTRRAPTPPVVIRQPAPAAAVAAATHSTHGRTTLPPPAAPARGNAPWLVAILFALVAGGLAVALAFALSRESSVGAVPSPPTSEPPPPPTETVSPSPAPPSATPDPAAAATTTITATAEPSVTPEPPTATVPNTVTTPPRPLPPTAAPPPSATPTTPPSATPEPSQTATATPAPTDTPTPTTVVAQCDNTLLQGGFGRVFDQNIAVRSGLGCPLAGEVAGDGSVQFFEQGTMFYWDDVNQPPKNDYIYVFYGRNTGSFDELDPDTVATYGTDPTPGPDPNQPMRGFGRVYFFKPGARELLGAPISPEIALRGVRRGVMQQYQKGMMIYTPFYEPTESAAIFVLFYNEGTFQRFDDTPVAAARRESI